MRAFCPLGSVGSQPVNVRPSVTCVPVGRKTKQHSKTLTEWTKRRLKENVGSLLSFPINRDWQSAYFCKHCVRTVFWPRLLNVSRLKLLRNRLATLQFLKICIHLTIWVMKQSQSWLQVKLVYSRPSIWQQRLRVTLSKEQYGDQQVFWKSQIILSSKHPDWSKCWLRV